MFCSSLPEMVRSKKSDPLFWAFGFPISIWKWEKCHTSPLTIHTANLSLFDSSPFQSGILPAPPFAFRFSAATHWVAVETPLQGADFFALPPGALLPEQHAVPPIAAAHLSPLSSLPFPGLCWTRTPKKCSTYSLHRFPKQWIFGNIRTIFSKSKLLVEVSLPVSWLATHSLDVFLLPNSERFPGSEKLDSSNSHKVAPQKNCGFFCIWFINKP